MTADERIAANREAKAERWAKLLHGGGVTAAQVTQMTADQWGNLHEALTAAGVALGNGRPSAQTIAFIISWMLRTEGRGRPPQKRCACGAMTLKRAEERGHRCEAQNGT